MSTPHIHNLGPNPKFTPCIHTLKPHPKCHSLSTTQVYTLGPPGIGPHLISTVQVHTSSLYPLTTPHIHTPGPHPAVAPCCLLTGRSWSRQTSGKPTSLMGLPISAEAIHTLWLSCYLVSPSHRDLGTYKESSRLYPEASMCHPHPKSAWGLSYRSIKRKEINTP